jgi:hypothetical protein
MRISPFVIASLLMAASISAPLLGTARAQNATTMKVTASGAGSGGSSMTPEQVQQLALADAKRMALEQAGTLLTSETQVDNFELTKDQIKAFAQGLVKVLKVTEQKCSYEDKIKALYCQVSIEAEVQTLEGKALLAKLAASQAQEKQAEGQGSLSFGFNVLAFTPAQMGIRGVRIKPDSPQTYQHVELKENGVLHSGDEFQIRFTPSQDAYVYVINVDTRGQVYPMLPNPEGMRNNHLKAGQNYTLPAAGKYYQLDDYTGTETIYLVAARQPMADIEYLLQQQGDQVASLLNASVSMRGISAITSGASQTVELSPGIQIQDLEERIKGSGSVVRVFRFQHR